VNFSYSQSYYPPAPIVNVVLLSAAEGLRVGPLTALVDSGADGSIVPLVHLAELRAPTTAEIPVRGTWSDSRTMLLYLIDVEIDGIKLPGIEVIGDPESDEIILGRDVLNRLRILLNGPRQLVDVTE
jgi:predicted aspartyl protease